MQASNASERLSSPLANQIEELTRDLDWTLAHFSFVAHVTTLKAECDIAHSPAMSVASSHTLRQPDLAFIGDSADLLATYATFLIDPGSEIELLVNATQRDVVSAAFKVRHTEPAWQMVFRGDPDALDSGRATELVDNDLPAMQSLTKSEDVDLRFVARDPFEQGPAFGIWKKRKLVAMGTTNVRVSGAVQIGNIIAKKASHEHNLRAEITAVLVKAHIAEGTSVFLIVSQSDEAAIQLFEGLGFVRERPMYRMRCVLE